MQWRNRERWLRVTPGLWYLGWPMKISQRGDIWAGTWMRLRPQPWASQGEENEYSKVLSVVNIHFFYNQIKKHKVISFCWKRKKIFKTLACSQALEGPPSSNWPPWHSEYQLWNKWVALNIHPWFYSTSFKSKLYKGLGWFPSLTNISEENVSQRHYLSTSRNSCWMLAWCPATEGCGACKRSMKHIAGYCLRNPSKNATCLELDM